MNRENSALSSSSAGGQSQSASLRAWDILANLPVPRFQAYTRLAAHLLDAPFAVISMRGEDGLAPRIFHGIEAHQIDKTPIFRDVAVMNAPAPMIVEDMGVDVRFSQDPIVTGPIGLRFCMALPLYEGKDHPVGVLWIMDRQPRDLKQNDLYRMTEFATCISQTLQLRHEVEALSKDALSDSVTGLGNRAAFECQLDTAMQNARRNTGLTVLSVRTDRLQTVNGMFGFAGGNQILRDMTKKLQEVVDPSVFIARIGGGEFAILLPDIDDMATGGLLASKIMEQLSHPIVIGGQSLTQNIAVGIALYPQNGMTASTLLDHAAATSWVDPNVGAGENAPVMFDAPLGFTEQVATHPLEADLRHALENDQFYLYWQPMADGESRQSVGFEALLRWERPGYGPVPPAEFISAAEQCGLASSLDAWVLYAACKEAAKWPDRTLRAAVNVSSQAASLATLSDSVAAALQATSFNPARLEIEIAEQVLIEDEVAVRQTLEALRYQGVRIALDNFGCSAAAVDCLRDLPIDKLKLDRGLTREIISDFATRDKVRDTMKLSRVNGFIVVAQGVESEEQLSCLKALGCDQMQGYLLGWPRPIVATADEHPSLQRA